MKDYDRQIRRAERLKRTLYADMPITCTALDLYIARCREAIAADEACEEAWSMYQKTLSIHDQPTKAAVLRGKRA